MSLSEELMKLGSDLPAPFQTQKDGSLTLEYVVAERKGFLSSKKVTYRCRVRADDSGRSVKMFEMLKESGFGISGGSDELGPGVSFRKEVTQLKGLEQEGYIDEHARLLGAQYKCQFDFAKVRNVVKQVAANAGYAFSMVLLEKSV